MNLGTLQKRFGSTLGKVLKSPELTMALIFLRAKRRDFILNLSPEDIQNRAPQILGGIQDELRFENDLINLHNQREFKLPDEGLLQYVSPEEESLAWEAIDKYREHKNKKQAA